jgi:hypothetical protein
MSKKRKNNLITPSQEIIGKNKSFNPVEDFSQKIELDERESINYEERKEYNKNIHTHPEHVTNLAIRDNYLLVRLYKYDQESMSEGGIILEDTEVYATHGGQMRARVKQNPYQRRGIIVKSGKLNYSEEWSDLMQPGAVIHIPDNKLKEHHVDKTKKTDIGHGYFMINAATVEAVELDSLK